MFYLLEGEREIKLQLLAHPQMPAATVTKPGSASSVPLSLVDGIDQALETSPADFQGAHQLRTNQDMNTTTVTGFRS